MTTTTTTTTSGAADLLDLIEAYAEARHRQGHSSYNAQTATALQAVKGALAAGQATAAQADSVQEDAALWRWLAEYLVGTRTDLDDEIVASETVNDLRKLVKAAIKQGEKQ